MAAPQNWSKEGEMRWEYTKPIPSRANDKYDAEIHVIDHGSNARRRYEVEMALTESGRIGSKVDGYLIGSFSNKEKARKAAVDFARNVKTVDDIRKLNLPAAQL